MYVWQVLRDYRVAWRHNPRHFYPKSFRIEREGRRLVLTGTVKRRCGKGYRVVGILKPRK